MSAGVFDHPWAGSLFGDPEIAACFTAPRSLDHYLAFELALNDALADAGLITTQDAQDIAAAMENFTVDQTQLATGFANDGIATAAYVRAAKEHLGKALGASFHFGATSQDLIDTDLALVLKDANAVLLRRLDDLTMALSKLNAAQGTAPLMARTRMQAALSFNASDRIAAWLSPLEHCMQEARAFPQKLYVIQLGGPIGTNQTYGKLAQNITNAMAKRLLLCAPDTPWHSDRTRIMDYANWLAKLTGGLGKIATDVALMAQNGIDDISLSGGGGSSAMAHKKNPVLAEVIIAQARYNAGQMGLIHQAMLHEQERSGSAWALEWMVLPQMIMTAGSALKNANALAGQIERIGQVAP